MFYFSPLCKEIFSQLIRNDSSTPVSTLPSQSVEQEDLSKIEKETSHSEENFQKKILPWESFVQSTLSDPLEYEETMFRESVISTKQRSEIIVVATLIDKIPNLAGNFGSNCKLNSIGLARTCEIFNATALVLANKKVEATPQFADISVTAEKWLPILEVFHSICIFLRSIQVPEFELAQFLEEKKTEGWTLLGVEQTANSASLVDFVFPKKCVLLLGT